MITLYNLFFFHKNVIYIICHKNKKGLKINIINKGLKININIIKNIVLPYILDKIKASMTYNLLKNVYELFNNQNKIIFFHCNIYKHKYKWALLVIRHSATV